MVAHGRLWSFLLIGFLALWAIAEVSSGLILAARADSFFGILLSPDGRVETVLPASPAGSAGIRAGDRIALAQLSSRDRGLLTLGEYKPPGTALVVDVARGRSHRRMRLVSRAESLENWPTLIAALATSLVFVGVALALVLMRPDIVTWSFYLFACGYTIVQFGSLQFFIRPPFTTWYILTLGVALTMTLAGGSTFTTRFPRGTTTKAGRILERIMAPAILCTVALFVAMLLLPATRAGAQYVRIAYGVALLTILALNVVAVLYRHAASGGEDRARQQWVIAGTAVALGALIVDFVLRLVRIGDFSGSALDVVLTVSVVLIPISIAYAVLRHRVIDVRFVLNRALVFGLITTGSVLAFSLVEWVVGKELEATQVALYAEMGLALAIGFSFDRLKRFVDRVVEQAFFRRQHAAAERLRRAADALPHAGAASTVDDLLTSEPLEAYELSSAALFRRVDDGRFFREASHGWDVSGDVEVAKSDPLLAYLAAHIKPLDLHDAPSRVALPDGAARPEVAVPIAARNQLIAFALYGPHASGETLDPEERETLADLAVAAAAAYDHLETVGLRQDLDALRRELEALRSDARNR